MSAIVKFSPYFRGISKSTRVAVEPADLHHVDDEVGPVQRRPAVGRGVISVATARVFVDLSEFATQAAKLSVYLAVFNLIPVPPLDGSKILIALRFPPFLYNELARFGFILLLLAYQFTNLGYWIQGTSMSITNTLFHLVQGV